jgi:hypothetical protein
MFVAKDGLWPSWSRDTADRSNGWGIFKWQLQTRCSTMGWQTLHITLHHVSMIAPPSTAQRVKAGNNGNAPMAATRLIGLLSITASCGYTDKSLHEYREDTVRVHRASSNKLVNVLFFHFHNGSWSRPVFLLNQIDISSCWNCVLGVDNIRHSLPNT